MARIRTASSLDRIGVQELYFRTFAERERRLVSVLALNLLSEEPGHETISLVAESNGSIVGHIAFSPVFVNGNENWKGYILAPLGILPPYQKQRIGSRLIACGRRRLAGKGLNRLFVYGDPKYYGKFGFTANAAAGYLPPYQLQYPFGWQAIAIKKDDFETSPVRISCVASLNNPELW